MIIITKLLYSGEFTFSLLKIFRGEIVFILGSIEMESRRDFFFCSILYLFIVVGEGPCVITVERP